MPHNEKDLTDVNSGPPTAESTGEQATLLSRRFGFYTFPVEAPRNGEGGKKPLIKGWEQAATTDGSLFRHRPGANIGLALGRSGHLVLDVDRPEGEEAARELLGGEIPKTLTVRTGRDGGRHYYFKLPEGASAGSRNGIAPGLDRKAGGGYVLAPPSLHATGRRYVFEDPEVPIAELSEEQVQALVSSGPGYHEVLAPEELESRLAPGEGDERIEYVRELLATIPNDSNFDAREDWIGMAHSIRVACGEEYDTDAFELFDEWSTRWEGDGVNAYNPDETLRVFDSLPSSRSGGFSGLLRLSEDLGHEPSGRLLEALHKKKQLEAKEVFEPVPLAASELREDPYLDSGSSPPEPRLWLLNALNTTRSLRAEFEAELPSLSGEERQIAGAALIQQLQGQIGREAAAAIVRRALQPADRSPFTSEGVLRTLDLSTVDLNVPYLVQGLIPAASVGLLVAPHSMGKSFLAIDLALAVSFGGAWMGARVTERGQALFIVAEGQAAFPVRLAGWLVAHEKLRDRFTRDDLSDALSGRAIISRYPLRLDDPRLAEGLIRTIRKSGTRIVVMDTLGRLLGSEQSDDHNDTANSVMADLLQVAAETGATILLIHHTGHENTNRGRGASAWEQAADFVYLVQGNADKFSDGFSVTLVNKKLKDGERAKARAFVKREVPLTVDGESKPSAVVEHGEQFRPVPDHVLVFAVVEENPGIGTRSLRDAVSMGRRRLDAARDELFHMSAIENCGRSNKHEYHAANGWKVAFDGLSLDDEAPPFEPVDLSDRREEAPDA